MAMGNQREGDFKDDFQICEMGNMLTGDIAEDELGGESFNLDCKLLEGRNCVIRLFALCVVKTQ